MSISSGRRRPMCVSARFASPATAVLVWLAPAAPAVAAAADVAPLSALAAPDGMTGATGDSLVTRRTIASIADLRSALARAHALLRLGEARPAGELAERVVVALADAPPAARVELVQALLVRAEVRRRLDARDDALADATRAAVLAEAAGLASLAAQADIACAELLRHAGALDPAARRLESARRHGVSLRDPALDAVRLLAVANLALARDERAEALAWFERSATSAATAGVGAALVGAKAWSAAAGLLDEGGRRAEAISASRRAAFLAQRWPGYQAAYHGQLGSLLARDGDVDGAIAALRLAVEARRGLREVSERGDGVSGSRDTELLADLLLRRASGLADGEARSALLREAREAIEAGKAAELRDYFRDDCVTELQARITPIDRLPPGSAVVYPVLLPDRVELVLSLPDAIHQLRVPVDRERLTANVRRLRAALEKRTTREFIVPARELYDWLILPLEPLLAAASIDTLVFVPQGPLRTVPMAALHDGSRFLIERFAIATTPGLTLTDARPLRRANLRVLAAGLSRSVAGFPSLERVPEELARVNALLGGVVMQDEAFVAPRFGAQLERSAWSIVHIASHAQFDSDPARTFVLAFDGRLGIERLAEFVGYSQYRSDPIELLTLSACQTAAGDDRAALGLAGVAVRSGARSAIAGLWFVDDAVSAGLVSAFYRSLRDDPGASKARALQRAQVALIADRRYRHPGYWAPYLLIGNWQ